MYILRRILYVLSVLFRLSILFLPAFYSDYGFSAVENGTITFFILMIGVPLLGFCFFYPELKNLQRSAKVNLNTEDEDEDGKKSDYSLCEEINFAVRGNHYDYG